MTSTADSLTGETVPVDAAFVDDKLAGIVRDENLSQFILLTNSAPTHRHRLPGRHRLRHRPLPVAFQPASWRRHLISSYAAHR